MWSSEAKITVTCYAEMEKLTASCVLMKHVSPCVNKELCATEEMLVTIYHSLCCWNVHLWVRPIGEVYMSKHADTKINEVENCCMIIGLFLWLPWKVPIGTSSNQSYSHLSFHLKPCRKVEDSIHEQASYPPFLVVYHLWWLWENVDSERNNVDCEPEKTLQWKHSCHCSLTVYNWASLLYVYILYYILYTYRVYVYIY